MVGMAVPVSVLMRMPVTVIAVFMIVVVRVIAAGVGVRITLAVIVMIMALCVGVIGVGMSHGESVTQQRLHRTTIPAGASGHPACTRHYRPGVVRGYARGMNPPDASTLPMPPAPSLPTPLEWRRFAVGLLHAAGLAGLGAGVVFFVAANWQAWGVLGRFALLGAGVLLCAGLACWRVPPQRVGQGALLLGTLFVGALLALFGQTYQTGADLHELFFTWAALALPFALAALSGAVWAVWWIVLNVGLGLLCGIIGLDHLVWRLIAGWGWQRETVLMLPCVVNLGAAALFLALRATRFADAAPPWLSRLLLTIGLGYGTAAAMIVVLDRHDASGAALMLYGVISAAIAVGTWRAGRDVFPLTVLAGSWVAISTVALANAMRFEDIGAFFVVALWLIASSTVASIALMRWHRAWRGATEQGVSA